MNICRNGIAISCNVHRGLSQDYLNTWATAALQNLCVSPFSSSAKGSSPAAMAPLRFHFYHYKPAKHGEGNKGKHTRGSPLCVCVTNTHVPTAFQWTAAYGALMYKETEEEERLHGQDDGKVWSPALWKMLGHLQDVGDVWAAEHLHVLVLGVISLLLNSNDCLFVISSLWGSGIQIIKHKFSHCNFPPQTPFR